MSDLTASSCGCNSCSRETTSCGCSILAILVILSLLGNDDCGCGGFKLFGNDGCGCGSSNGFGLLIILCLLCNCGSCGRLF